MRGTFIYNNSLWLGIHDVYINSSIVDERTPMGKQRKKKKKKPIRLRADSSQFDSLDYFEVFDTISSI